MFTATLLALGTRLVKFQTSNFGFQACLSLISTQIFNFKHSWAHLMLNCSIFKAKLAKTDIFTKVEKWNFTSLVPRARSVAVNIFSKCRGTDEWTLGCPCLYNILFGFLELYQERHLNWVTFRLRSSWPIWPIYIYDNVLFAHHLNSEGLTQLICTKH